MSSCVEGRRIQDFLDGQMSEAEARAFSNHLAHCSDCTGEWVAYRRLFASLDRLPFETPAPALSGRILSRVLPSRVRRRWIATLGLSYGGMLAAFLVGIVIWTYQPSGRSVLASIASELSRRVVQSVIFALDAIAFAVMSVANGWGLFTVAGERLAPLSRALVTLLSHPALQAALWAAGAFSVAVLWWISARRKPSAKEVGHVGLLGF
jgi:anti-sigma factor RsiW